MIIEVAAQGVGCTRAASTVETSSAVNPTHQHANAQRKAAKLPPFGKQVSDDVREVWIYAGTNAWREKGDICRLIPGRVILPPGELPSAYRWPVASRDVFIVVLGDIDDTPLLQLAHECLRQGATVARVLDGAGRLSVHRREVRHVVA